MTGSGAVLPAAAQPGRRCATARSARGRGGARGQRYQRALSRSREVVGGLVTAALLGLVLLLGVAVAPSAAGFEALTILSESMEPGIPTGSLVLARLVEAEDVSVGDVVLLRRSGPGALPVLHRVIEARVIPGGVEVRTKGDSNAEPDHELSTLTGRTATPVWVVPLLGQLHFELTTPRGWVSFVVVPAVAVCALWLVRIWSPRRVARARADPHTGAPVA